MNLYLLRHGIAAQRGSYEYSHDSERPLTEEGVEKLKAAAKAMKKLEIIPDCILSSPYRRAKETAEIAGAYLNSKLKIIFTNHLTPEAHSKELIKLINSDYSAHENILLASHEPFLSQLISVLVTGSGNSEIVMRKGGLCRLSLNHLSHGPCAALEWLLTPKQLSLIAGG